MKITATVKSLEEILKTGNIICYGEKYIKFDGGAHWFFDNNNCIGKNIEVLKSISAFYNYTLIGEHKEICGFKREWLTDIKEMPDWEIDTPILVWDEDLPDTNYRRYFAGLTGNGKIKAWDDGATSWSGNENWTNWDHAKLV